MTTRFIRYLIDPAKKGQFDQYARNWGEAIPRCGHQHSGSREMTQNLSNCRKLYI